MAKHIVTNGKISIGVNDFGAELCELKDSQTDQNYMWNADPAYWKRYSPILFPIVGSLKNKEYTYNGKKYTMSQHGFARDCDFQLVEKTDTKIVHRLVASEATKEVYPFDFSLEITYELDDRIVNVIWKVKNEDQVRMPFSIGGHPAFLCPLYRGEKQTDYYIQFDTEKEITCKKIDENGLAKLDESIIALDHGILPITEHLFDEDALVIEKNQAHKLSLLTPDKKPYLTVTFDAPLFGVWSPAKKNAPFICLEPWYGRCDGVDFDGTLEEREWGQSLEPKEEMVYKYSIQI